MVAAGDVVLGVLPLFHVYGLNAVLGSVLRHGATLVLVDHFDPRGTLDVVAEHGVTVVPVAPAVFPHWLRCDDLATVDGRRAAGASGSAPLARAVIEEFTARTGVPVHQGYGLTEAAPVVTSTLASTAAGAGLAGLRAARRRPARSSTTTASSPRPVTPARCRSAGQQPVQRLLARRRRRRPGPTGWWATGDVGYLDDGGDLFLVDRAAEVVVVAGFRVYPHEVEAVIGQVPGVVEAAVIGVPDDATGHAVVAYVRAPDAETAAVVEAVREPGATRRLAAFKRPTRIEVVDELPTTLAGRVRKGELRQLERRRALGMLGVTAQAAPRVIMYGRPGCHLCEVRPPR